MYVTYRLCTLLCLFVHLPTQPTRMVEVHMLELENIRKYSYITVVPYDVYIGNPSYMKCVVDNLLLLIKSRDEVNINLEVLLHQGK